MKQIIIITVLLSISSLALGRIGMENFPPRSIDEASSQGSNERTRQLRSIIRDKELRKSDPDRVTSAIAQLGEMRSAESVDDLIELLTFRRSLHVGNADPNMIREIHPVAPSEQYPATEALIQIGTPSLAALVRVIETHELGSVESENANFAVSMIFREDPEAGASYLRSAASRSSNRQSISRLQTAANRLGNLARKLKKSN